MTELLVRTGLAESSIRTIADAKLNWQEADTVLLRIFSRRRGAVHRQTPLC